MDKIRFNHNWRCYPAGNESAAFQVTIPHDAMQRDRKSPTSPGGVNTGWYEAQDYIYEKTFTIAEEDRDKDLYLEFEGVYHKATVYLNEERVAWHDYGYTGFRVPLRDAIRYGAVNTVRVEAVNSDQPNSRWYSGTGIYRPVWLLRFPKEHILPDGIRITTVDYDKRQIAVTVETTSAGTVRAEILDGATVLAQEEGVTAANPSLTSAATLEFTLPECELWSPDRPRLYTCRVTYGEDVRETTFGIRTVTCTPEEGFCINGERVILRGACIHHDNGLLGACAYDYAEARKVRLLKENGYNAIRSAHNPCSVSMLEACDRLGMLVMDEYVDVWYIHKTKYDYATEVEAHYAEDLRDMVDKDYNHPSVIMYSTGNEVAESAQTRGIDLCGRMTAYLHEIDGTRPVSCGINIFFNMLSRMGFGVYSDKKADQAIEDASKKKAVGSEFFNNLAGFMGADFMKFGATLYPCDVLTRDAFANMDVAGYNYGIRRYEHDLRKYPNRLILGSETFCSDAGAFYDLARKERRIIGDYVWSGMDYLGEVGVGAWEYADYAPDTSHGVGWVTAGSGRIDLTGKPLAEMTYTRVAFGLEPLGLAVEPVQYAGQRHSPSAWKMSNALESWTFPGCEGQKARVEIYARAARVELLLNGVCVAQVRPDKNYRGTASVAYAPGELKAVSYDTGDTMIAERSLRTAGEETILSLVPEEMRVPAEDGLFYVRMQYTDAAGEVKPTVRGDIKVTVNGGTLVGLGSACPYYPRGYQGDTADTYYGEAMAIIRPDGVGAVRVAATSPFGASEVMLTAF